MTSRHQKTITTNRLKYLLYTFDWIKILNEAIKSRPTSWETQAVREWRNAGDTICFSVIQAFIEAGIFPTHEEELHDFKERMKAFDKSEKNDKISAR